MEWPILYSNYIELYQKGLKKQAKEALINFINDFKKKSTLEKRSFINNVNAKAFETGRYSAFLPYNLYHEFVLPEIKKWIVDEPNNPIPKKWSNDLMDNKEAIQLDPDDQVALEIFAQSIISKISMNQHEINSGFAYDGNPVEDITLIDFFETYTDKIQQRERKLEIQNILRELKKCAINAINS